jgi:DNA-binding HxlR family transcriptional regulator
MEKKGLLKRTVYPEVPPKVEYEITPLGLTLKSVVDAMHQWGTEHDFQKSSDQSKPGPTQEQLSNGKNEESSEA